MPTLLTRIAFGIVVSVFAACSSGDRPAPPPSAAAALFERRNEPGLEMRVALMDDTVDGHRPIEAVYFVVNGPTPTPFLNHPGLVGVWVETPDGELAPVWSSSSATPNPGPQAEVTLLAYGILGQREDLRCVRSSGYSDAVPGNCVMEFRLNRRGRYHVIARYSAPQQGPFAHPVISDTAVLVIR